MIHHNLLGVFGLYRKGGVFVVNSKTRSRRLYLPFESENELAGESGSISTKSKY